MRTIKFRAWITTRKLMQNVLDIEFENDGEIESICTIDNKYRTPNITIMQFTGLYDKNGKEIYEDDVVKFKSTSMLKAMCGGPLTERVLPISYNENELCFWVGGDDGFKPDKITDDNQFEVIGNLHENPELL